MALNMISAEELYYEPLDQDATEMIIEDMIPKGLTLLAGAPKSGKSWMALDMALAVSSGRDFLQRQTKSCGVIYLTLEDSMERVQKRLLNISESPPGNLHICIETKTMGQGFLKELAETLENYPDTGLIIIDILQKIRDYLLGYRPKRKNYKPLSPEMRAALRKCDMYSRQAKLLCREHLQTNEDVLGYMDQCEKKIVELSDQRQRIYNKLRRCKDPEKTEKLKEERDKLTSQLKEVRQERKDLIDVLKRSDVLSEDIAREYAAQKRERQRQKNMHRESIRR